MGAHNKPSVEIEKCELGLIEGVLCRSNTHDCLTDFQKAMRNLNVRYICYSRQVEHVQRG